MYIRKILLSSFVFACLLGLMSGCAPIMPAPTIERVIVPINRNIDRNASKVYYYRVRTGDTLYAISQLHGLSVAQIAHMNGITEPYVIHPGQRLVVDRTRISQERIAAVVKTEERPKTTTPQPVSKPPAPPVHNTRVAGSGVQVTKLPRPAPPPAESTSNRSNSLALTEDKNARSTLTVEPPKDSKSDVSSKDVGSKPPANDKGAQSTSERAVTQSPVDRSSVGSTSSPKPRTIANASTNTPKKESSQPKPNEATPGFVARTEATNQRPEATTQRDVNSLPRGWSWPVAANPTNTFGKDDGLNYYLNQGNKVAAAASGRVTYAGVALSDYKYMVLIKTPDEYVIQYDFNVDLTVQENDLVSKGQNLLTIADSNKAKRPTTSDEYRKVFFAIRKKGIPQNPNKLIGSANSRES